MFLRMKRLFFLLFSVILCQSLLAQESQSLDLPAINNEVETSLFSLSIQPSLTTLKTTNHVFGNFNLPLISSYSAKKKVNIFAPEEVYMASNQKTNTEFPQRQLEQINSTVQVYYNQTNFNQRTNVDLNYYGKRTLDGGIKNEVYEDVRQPLLNTGYYLHRNRYDRNQPVFYLRR